MKIHLLTCLVCSICTWTCLGFASQVLADVQDNGNPVGSSGKSSVFLPSRFPLAFGVGLRPRLLFGQESFYQESWGVSAAAHWSCRIVERCELLGRLWYQVPLAMPEQKGALSVGRTERNFGFDVGIESRALFLSGIALGLSSVERKYALSVEEGIVNKSGVQNFKEEMRLPTARIWVGMPLWPESIDLLLSVNRIFSDEAEPEKQTYASEIRFNL